MDPVAVFPELDVLVSPTSPTRWGLCGPGTAVARAVDEVLSGRARVFGLAGVVVVDGPLDLPVAVASSPEALWAVADSGPAVPTEWAALLASDRVTPRVRALHARRALPDDPAYTPAALDQVGLATLRALAAVVVPQDGPPAQQVDVAARVDEQLASGEGDGWRHADLPPDAEAFRVGLAALAQLPALDEAVVTRAAAGELDPAGPWTADQLRLWLQDAVNALVREWLVHPANLARVGYDGFAVGGDTLLGFELLGAGERESWEPAA